MKKKRTLQDKMIRGWALLALFLMPFVARSFHSSYEKISLSNPEAPHSRHDCNDCPVCQFHYFAFTGTEFPEMNPELFPLFVEPFFYDEKEYQPFLYSYFLRGPPLL
jgi:hypothetical protein